MVFLQSLQFTPAVSFDGTFLDGSLIQGSVIVFPLFSLCNKRKVYERMAQLNEHFQLSALLPDPSDFVYFFFFINPQEFQGKSERFICF